MYTRMYCDALYDYDEGYDYVMNSRGVCRMSGTS